MGKFLSAQQTAAAIIAKSGSRVTLKRTGSSGFDPVTQQETSVIQTFEFLVAVAPPSQQAQYTVGTLEGRNALEMYFALKGQTTNPQPGDVVVIKGEDYKVFWAQTYDPALDGPILTLAYAERGS
ncbi:hypothetical protein UFOVP32_9 [uncultured Caudovirales phage]|uniref:Uncharacterized protein n=1 Tax=uncultured Caudovirales phage TaxID=2100421 RepID=A0A6J5KQG8_9CAUD|nr:hypothetical protein UFOVP32_9 [uncultured Caudovirales phage]CAB4123811.1 hypothetical protein UFOVP50_67 [uncultured Caudovirales phage]